MEQMHPLNHVSGNLEVENGDLRKSRGKDGTDSDLSAKWKPEAAHELHGNEQDIEIRCDTPNALYGGDS